MVKISLTIPNGLVYENGEGSNRSKHKSFVEAKNSPIDVTYFC
jgi:hypothetical protein